MTIEFVFLFLIFLFYEILENSSDCKEIGDVFERAITQMEQCKKL